MMDLREFAALPETWTPVAQQVPSETSTLLVWRTLPDSPFSMGEVRSLVAAGLLLTAQHRPEKGGRMVLLAKRSATPPAEKAAPITGSVSRYLRNR